MSTETVTAPCGLDTEWLGYWGDEPSGVACGEPSGATVRLACVHEHIDTVRVCSACAADMQQATGALTCPRCWNGKDRHPCYMLVVIGWDSGEKTIAQAAR